MQYTFVPKEKFAKASGSNLRISTKSAEIICRVIRRKPLKRAKRLLADLAEERRSLQGKYYTKTVAKILELVESCEKNAEFLGLDNERLFVHASAHQGANFRRRRRKGGFGSRMKTTNMEIILIEKGKASGKVQKSQMKKKSDAEKKIENEQAEAKKAMKEIHEKTAELKEKVETAAVESGS